MGDSEGMYSGSLGSPSLLDPISSSSSEGGPRSGENLPLALIQSRLIFLGEVRGCGILGEGERGGAHSHQRWYLQNCPEEDGHGIRILGYVWGGLLSSLRTHRELQNLLVRNFGPGGDGLER